MIAKFILWLLCKVGGCDADGQDKLIVKFLTWILEIVSK